MPNLLYYCAFVSVCLLAAVVVCFSVAHTTTGTKVRLYVEYRKCRLLLSTLVSEEAIRSRVPRRVASCKEIYFEGNIDDPWTDIPLAQMLFPLMVSQTGASVTYRRYASCKRRLLVA